MFPMLFFHPLPTYTRQRQHFLNAVTRRPVLSIYVRFLDFNAVTLVRIFLFSDCFERFVCTFSVLNLESTNALAYDGSV